MMQSKIRKLLPYRYYNAVLFIIGGNLLIFMITMLSPLSRIYLAMIPQWIVQGKGIWQFVTYMFTHAGLSHILFNMLGLFIFGFPVEKRMGSSEFLLFYFISGIGAGLFSFFFYLLTGYSGVILLGASGAVFAVLLAYATLFPDSVIYIMGILPIRAPVLVLVYTAIELFSQIFYTQSGVAHLTHLAGFLFAFLYFRIRIGIDPLRIFFNNNR